MAPVEGGPPRRLLSPPTGMAPTVVWKGLDPHFLVAYASESDNGVVSSIRDVRGATGIETLSAELLTRGPNRPIGTASCFIPQ